MTSVPMATIMSSGRSARRTRVTRGRITWSGLPRGERFAALDPEKALGDAVVDEVPGQTLGLAVRAMDVVVRRRKSVESIALPGADDAPPVAVGGVHGLDEPRDAAVAAREDGLQVRLARRLDVELRVGR